MDKIPSATGKSNEEEKYCVRPSQSQKIRFRVHYRGYFVDTPVKLYVAGLISEMNWKWDVDYLSYFELLELIKKEGYRDIMCVWYWNPRFSFTRGLRKINDDGDVLQLIRDAEGCELIDLYVEHSISELDIVDDEEVGHNITSDDDEVECTGEKIVDEVEEDDADDNVEPDNNDEVEPDNNVEVDDNVDAEVGDAEVGDAEVDIDVEVCDAEVDIDAEVGDAEVGVDAEVDNEPDLDSEFDLESEPDLDWATVIPTEPVTPHNKDNDFHHDNGEDSDQLQTPPESEDDEEYERYPTYKVGEGIKLQLGMIFNNKDLVREAIKEYAMMEKKNVYLKKNDAKRMVVRCIDECKFYMRIGKRVGNHYWQVVSLYDEHNCHRTAQNRQAKTGWLGKQFSHILRHNLDLKPSGLVALAFDKWGVKLSSDQAYRAKRRAMDIIQGAGRDQFTHLRTYANELLKSNPHSNIVLKCSDSSDGPVFERIYICLEACKAGFACYCRPLIGLDACFLKGDYGGQLMAAIGRDGNNQIFPIAYAVVEAETEDSWEWFLNLLLEDLQGINQREYAFISDQQKGLVPAIQGLSEHVDQRLCVKHLYGNWKKNPGMELKEALWSAARAITIQGWERAMLRMKALNESAWKDMKNVPAQYWSRSHFRTYSKCDLQVNNMCEAFNRAILENRDKPIITLLEGIKHYLTKRITYQKELMVKYTGNVCPRVQLALEKNKKFAEHWTPTWHGDDDMAIFGVINSIETYCVNIKEGTCACRKWDLTGIPCSHAITCMWHNKKHPEEYISEYYRKSTFQKTYSHIIYPTNGPQLWPVDGTLVVNPPVMRRTIRRPKKLRNKTNDEPKNPHVLPRKISTVTCTKCGFMGHNKRTCKGKRAADRVMPKGGNKKQKITKGKGKGKGKGAKTASQPTQEVGSCSQGPPTTQD